LIYSFVFSHISFILYVVLEDKRRTVAYVLGRMVSGLPSAILYDYTGGASHHFSGIATDKVEIYDVSRKCFLTGNKSKLYDYGTESTIEIKVAGNRFAGRDIETNSHFNGHVNGNMITFFDAETCKYYDFSI
jgi:hypothetical protein